MKKTIAAVLAVSMTLSAVFAGSVGVFAEESGKVVTSAAVAALPIEADHGFVLTEESTIDVFGADVSVYTHEQTGAEVIHVDNGDTNRALLVGFDTPPLNNKGIPHVFEHITTGGNEKYPSPALFFALIYQSYNTFINATTGNSYTNYLYASMSEEQLLLMTDYYMNATLYPTIYSDPENLGFKREAWHYELADADAPLNVTGIVYSEMKGSMNHSRVADMNLLNALYPGSVVANNSGGNPADVLTLTVEEFQEFHSTYYHPSNATIFLYGDLEIDTFLGNIGHYFNAFDYEEIYVEKGEVEPLGKHVTNVYEFPMESDANTDNNTIVHYAVDLGKINIDEFLRFNMLSNVLNAQSSPLKTKLREALPAANTYIWVSATSGNTAFVVEAQGVNEEDAETIKSVVDSVIADIIANGFDDELIDSVIANQEFQLLSASESSGYGVNLAATLQSFKSMGFGIDYYNSFQAFIETVKKEYKNGFFEKLISDYIVGNPSTVLIATVPAPGLKDELDAELRAELDEIKSNMSEDEIAEIIAMNEKFAAINSEVVPPEVLESLNAVTVDTLPVEIAEYDITDKVIDGLRVLTAEAPVGGINTTSLLLNSSVVSLDELHFLNLYANLITQLPTENYELSDLQTKIARYLPTFYTAAGANVRYDKTGIPMFVTTFMTLNDDYEEAAELVKELILRTDLSDLSIIEGIAGRLRTNLRSGLNASGHALLYQRALANSYDIHAYTDYMSNLPYYEFIKNVPSMIADDPEGFIEKLESVRSKLVYKDGSAVLFAGNEEGLEVFNKHIGKVTDLLQDGDIPEADYSAMPRPGSSEGIIIDSAVQANVVFATLEDLGLEYSGKLDVLSSVLTDSFLLPEVRYVLGAYTTGSIVNNNGFTMISSRDPGIAETFAAFERAADFAANSTLTQEDIDRYIISLFPQITVPTGALNGAITGLELKYLGYPDDYRQNLLEEIKSTTAEDFIDFAQYLELLTKKGSTYSSGGQSAILANADMYDSIIYAFGEPGTEEEIPPLTRLQFLESLFGEADGLFDQAIAMGILRDDGSPDDLLTREEFAVALVAAMGGVQILADVDPAGVPAITDEALINDWAIDIVKLLLAAGIMQLDEDGNFNPKGGVTLDELMLVLAS